LRCAHGRLGPWDASGHTQKEDRMPKVSKETASHVEQMPGFEGRYEQLGEYTVGFERFDEDIDAAPLFRGLPDDRCQSPHWGVVVKGSITFRSADGEETVGAGEVYYAPPGHTPVLTAGTELIEFSPTEALQQTMEVVGRNAAAMSA
jgi:hypothetical protein